MVLAIVHFRWGRVDPRRIRGLWSGNGYILRLSVLVLSLSLSIRWAQAGDRAEPCWFFLVCKLVDGLNKNQRSRGEETQKQRVRRLCFQSRCECNQVGRIVVVCSWDFCVLGLVKHGLGKWNWELVEASTEFDCLKGQGENRQQGVVQRSAKPCCFKNNQKMKSSVSTSNEWLADLRWCGENLFGNSRMLFIAYAQDLAGGRWAGIPTPTASE